MPRFLAAGQELTVLNLLALCAQFIKLHCWRHAEELLKQCRQQRRTRMNATNLSGVEKEERVRRKKNYFSKPKQQRVSLLLL